MTDRVWDGLIHASEIHSFASPCKRKYWFQYSGTSPTIPKANLELGTAIHAIHATYLESGQIVMPKETIRVPFRVNGEERHQDYAPEDQVALAQVSWAHLPAPGEGYTEVPWAYTYRGISFAGTIDYLHASKRLVVDHKTTSNLRWAKTTAELTIDPQVLLYGYAAQIAHGPGTVDFLWSYTQTRTKPAWRGVEFSLMSQEIQEGMCRVTDTAEQILEYHARNPDPMSLQPAPSECTVYGRLCDYRSRCTDVTDLQIELNRSKRK